MKNKILIGALFGAIFVGFTFAGIKTGASSDWSNEVVSQANKELGAFGFAKKEELVTQDFTGQMMIAANPKIEEEKAELEKLFDDYYKMKLAGLTDTPEFKAVEERIEAIKITIFERYKGDIDQVFNKK